MNEQHAISQHLREAYEERAAIMEYDGNMAREEAEELAYQDAVLKKIPQPTRRGKTAADLSS